MNALVPAPETQACRVIMAKGSRSFTVASRLLAAERQHLVVALYAWCRRADDAVDDAPAGTQREALERLERELDSVYGGVAQADPVLVAFQSMVRRTALPRVYADELLAGMRMDVEGVHYRTREDLLVYCHRVAGVVGLMMCHVMGVSTDQALPHAAHLGMAMQLTNICRDVQEDWERGRLYLPAELLREAGAPGELTPRSGVPIPEAALPAVRRVVLHLLALADRLYRSGDQGLPMLPWRAALAVRAARRIYAAIGHTLRRRDADVRRGRVVVSGLAKLGWVLWAAAAAGVDALRRGVRPAPGHAAPGRVLDVADALAGAAP